jgi:hypothetical protein
MGYACLTTKHHDGFCLWPTATNSPSVMNSSFRQDIVRSYVDSFRRKGLKVCLYFSILDLRADIRANQINTEKIDLIKAQMTELLTNYGEITALIIDDGAQRGLVSIMISFRFASSMTMSRACNHTALWRTTTSAAIPLPSCTTRTSKNTSNMQVK